MLNAWLCARYKFSSSYYYYIRPFGLPMHTYHKVSLPFISEYLTTEQFVVRRCNRQWSSWNDHTCSYSTILTPEPGIFGSAPELEPPRRKAPQSLPDSLEIFCCQKYITKNTFYSATYTNLGASTGRTSHQLSKNFQKIRLKLLKRHSPTLKSLFHAFFTSSLITCLGTLQFFLQWCWHSY